MSIIILTIIECTSILVGFNGRNYQVYSPYYNITDLFLFCGLMLFVGGMNLFFDFLFKKSISKGKDRLSLIIFSNYKKLFFSTLIIIVFVWSIYFFASFPGGAWYDTGNQICQFMGVETRTRANPILQTILSGGSFKIGVLLGKAEYGIALYIIAQIIVSALIVSYSMISLCKILPSKLTVILVLSAYVVNPIVPIYVINIGKDTNFGFLILLAYVCMTNISVKKRIDKTNGILLFVSLVLISLLRNIGILFSALLSLVLLFITVEKRKSILLCLSSFALVFIFQSITMSLLKVDKTNNADNLSVPLLQMGGYINSFYNDLNENEINVLNNVLDVEQIHKEFDVNISDPLKVSFVQHNPSKEQLSEFWNLYIVFLQRHPGKFVEVLIGKSYGYFDPLTGEMRKPFTIIGLSPIAGYIEEMLGISLKNTVHLTEYTQFVNLLKTTYLVNLLTHCGFYMWLLLFGFFMSYRYKINRLLMIPMVGFVIGLIGSPVNAYFRYCFPITLVAPFWLLMVYSINNSRLFVR